MRSDRQKEVDKNYEAFKEKLPELLKTHRNKFALMRHGDIVNFYESAADARRTGETFFKDHLFSVQQVTETPIDLGYFSHAVHLWNVRSGPRPTAHFKGLRYFLLTLFRKSQENRSSI